MALNTLRGVKKIGKFNVVVMDKLREKYPKRFNSSGSMDYKWFEKSIRPKNFVYVRNDVNSISFTIQNGPVKENGVNGCQVDTIIEAALLIVKGLNKKAPSGYNQSAIWSLEAAIHALKMRTKDRKARGVEGTSKR